MSLVLNNSTDFLQEAINMYGGFVTMGASSGSSPRIGKRCDKRHSATTTRDKSPRIASPKPNLKRHTSPNLCQKFSLNSSSLNHAFANICLNEASSKDQPRAENSHSPTTAMSSSELANLIQREAQLILLDCRSFISFNLCHIRGAINVGCADKVTKRRLQSGKICVSDLIKCVKLRELFDTGADAELVIYDDNSQEINEGSCKTPDSLYLILKSLLSGERKVHFLKGGLVEFHAKYENLCTKYENLCTQAPSSTPLYSPTTPIYSNEIDTAVAARVLPFLYVGNERDVANKEKLSELGVTHILNMTSHIPCYFEDMCIFTYKRLNASDSGSQNLKQYFQEANHFIDDVRLKGGKVIVHCQAGVSRSATICLAYLMQHSNMSMMEAFKYLKDRRPIVAPNLNFMGQLMELEQKISSGQVQREVVLDSGVLLS